MIVTVEDRNDNSPRFLKPFYEIAIQEELPSGTNVLQVSKKVVYLASLREKETTEGQNNWLQFRL